MATHGRGLICLCLTPERCEVLGLRQMTDQNETPFGTAFTVSIEAREGVSTGHLRRRPGADDPGRDRSDLDGLRPRPAGSHLPAAGPLRRRPQALRADRGGRRPRAARRARAGRRRLRDHERGRDDGARLRPGRLLRAPRAEDGHRRRPDRVPAQAREPRQARGLGEAPDGRRPLPGGRLRGGADRQASRRARQGRRRRRRGRSRPRPLRVPHRRRVPLAALRLRRAARLGAAPDRGRGARRRSSTWRRRAGASAC